MVVALRFCLQGPTIHCTQRGEARPAGASARPTRVGRAPASAPEFVGRALRRATSATHPARARAPLLRRRAGTRTSPAVVALRRGRRGGNRPPRRAAIRSGPRQAPTTLCACGDSSRPAANPRIEEAASVAGCPCIALATRARTVDGCCLLPACSCASRLVSSAERAGTPPTVRAVPARRSRRASQNGPHRPGLCGTKPVPEAR